MKDKDPQKKKKRVVRHHQSDGDERRGGFGIRVRKKKNLEEEGD